MNRVLKQWLWCSALFSATGTALANCAKPTLLAPAERFTTDTRPATRWSTVTGATTYALKVQSRLPEGAVIASFDVVVTETQFVPPAALADERAKVTVSVAARCVDGVSATQSAWFLIDVTGNCLLPQPIRLKLDNGRAAADWAPAASATLYEVRLHAPLDGRVIRAMETREPRVVLDGDLPDGAVLSVRPRCAQGFGEPVFGWVTR